MLSTLTVEKILEHISPELQDIILELRNIVATLAPDAAEAFQSKFAGRYYSTPKKMGAQTEEANTNAGIAAAEQIRDFFEKGDVKYQVNK